VHRDVLFTCSRIRVLSNLHLRPLKTFISEFNLSLILLPKLALGYGLPLVSKRNNEPSRSVISEEFFGLLNDCLLKKRYPYLMRPSAT
jgi:hypothetical protein